MRTTVTIDDTLITEARELSGITENGALLREAVKALIERESARQLLQLQGTAPNLTDVPRRRAP